MSSFKLFSKFKPTGDQPNAIEKLAANLNMGVQHQTLLGVTGSGKTFTMANVVERVQKPTLVISHNKTLAMQLYQEFREFFPENAVHYFVSYYDYYQPEAYIPQTDTYIEKDAKINEMIDALRHASTASLLSRNDVIIVASVSCIYGIGDPKEYKKASIEFKVGDKISRQELLKRLVMLQYARNPIDPRQGHFRTRENIIEIYLPSGEEIIYIELDKSKIITIKKRSLNLSSKFYVLSSCRVFPAKHFVTPTNTLNLAIANIRQELKERLTELKKQGKILEAARLKQRTEFDLEMLEKTGYVNGIENYSRQLDFRKPGTPPHTLIDYFNYAYGLTRLSLADYEAKPRSNWLCFIDESHASIPQIRGMYAGDRSRKETLIAYGFRLPSALDNRPLQFPEFSKKMRQIIYASATPTKYELQISKQSYRDPIPVIQGSDPCIVEQLIRPTGILDPQIEVRPTKNQIRDVIAEIKKRITKNERSLVMALTKRLAEDIAEYLTEAGIKAEYLHSEVKTLERPETLKKLRTGEHDVIVGINLLREGLDLPEVSFIAILDADKEGFLRNVTTLLQIMGRAARHIDGKVILYADAMTGSMRAAINETNRRRKIQEDYNREHGITPVQIKKEIRKSLLEEAKKEDEFPLPEGPAKEIIKSLEREMKKASREMNFELAAKIRDHIKILTTRR
ncbi:MAG: excinuclease ABC subunit UvrB [Candidatus Sungbacteria bacterium]|nr:excinuclease ABC subunit UvrB [Candidatus Sungbacteria bacterium]